MLGNIGKMMKLAAEMKTKLPELQEQLAASTYDAQAGGGAVSATVNGKMQLVDLSFAEGVLSDPQLTADATMLVDLIKAAISAAQEKAADAAKQAMAELTGGMDLPGGLGGLLG